MKSVASGGWESGESGAGHWVLGLDVGGTGSRAALEPVEASVGPERHLFEGGRVAVASAGSSAADVAAALIADARAAFPDAALAAQ